VLSIVLQYFGAVEEVKPLGEIPILEGTVVIKEPVRCISNVIAHSDSAQQRCQDLIDLMYAACSTFVIILQLETYYQMHCISVQPEPSGRKYILVASTPEACQSWFDAITTAVKG